MTIWPRGRRRRRWVFCGGSLCLAWGHHFSLDERISWLGCEWIGEIKAGWGSVYFPPIAKSAMDGAPGHPGWVERTTARTEADPYGMTNKRTNKSNDNRRQRRRGGVSFLRIKVRPKETQ